MAIACFADRAPCFPSRTWWISSRTNSPAWVDADFPSALSRLARSIVSCSGIALAYDFEQALCHEPPDRLAAFAAGVQREKANGRAHPRAAGTGSGSGSGRGGRGSGGGGDGDGAGSGWGTEGGQRGLGSGRGSGGGELARIFKSSSVSFRSCRELLLRDMKAIRVPRGPSFVDSAWNSRIGDATS